MRNLLQWKFLRFTSFLKICFYFLKYNIVMIFRKYECKNYDSFKKFTFFLSFNLSIYELIVQSAGAQPSSSESLKESSGEIVRTLLLHYGSNVLVVVILCLIISNQLSFSVWIISIQLSFFVWIISVWLFQSVIILCLNYFH